jgi:hypothetical protein
MVIYVTSVMIKKQTVFLEIPFKLDLLLDVEVTSIKVVDKGLTV